ncbi:unnamed protein product [Prunus armeniaca]|uniref:Uncharacterized protein n=1 Tax=Prunus armeniaca TaxID=36596 RepID=A0A6J5WE66_PRUAR|nr:unnamed protein product [Prunus armeniaca]
MEASLAAGERPPSPEDGEEEVLVKRWTKDLNSLGLAWYRSLNQAHCTTGQTNL